MTPSMAITPSVAITPGSAVAAELLLLLLLSGADGIFVVGG